jgi:hypothetical protein
MEKIPRRKRKPNYSSSYSKVRIKEDIITNTFKNLDLGGLGGIRPTWIEKQEEWTETDKDNTELKFSETLTEYLRKENRSNLENILNKSRIPRPKVISNKRNSQIDECTTLALWKPNPLSNPNSNPNPKSKNLTRSMSMNDLELMTSSSSASMTHNPIMTHNQMISHNIEMDGYVSLDSDSDFGMEIE